MTDEPGIEIKINNLKGTRNSVEEIYPGRNQNWLELCLYHKNQPGSLPIRVVHAGQQGAHLLQGLGQVSGAWMN
jgi:hypothetical protein